MKKLITLAALVACALGGCLAAGQAASETSYTRDLLWCVDDAETLSESHECRARVDRKWEAGIK
jgi:hypothetical protein